MSLQENVQILLDIAYSCPTEIFLQNCYTIEVLYKKFTLYLLSVAILYHMNLVVFAKGLFKLFQLIFGPDHMKSSFGIFFDSD